MNKTILLTFAFLLALSVIVSENVRAQAVETGDSWGSKASMHVARSGLGVAVVDGKIYAIGGSTESGENAFPNGPNDIVGTNEEYSPTTNSWALKKSMPTPRFGFAIFVYQNRIYCIGGVTGFTVTGDSEFTKVNEVYDPATNTWQTKSPAPTARSGVTANLVGEKAYFIGGDDLFTLNEVYDPATDSWTNKSPMPNGITYSSAVIDKKIYCFVQNAYSPELQIYDTETNHWNIGASPLTNYYRGAAGATTGVFAPQRIYFLSSGSMSNQIYDPSDGTWILGAQVPSNRMDFAVAILNDTLYLIGGQNHQSLPTVFPGYDRYIVTQSAANEQYMPVGYGTITPIPSPSLTTTATPTSTPTQPAEPTQQPTPTASATPTPTIQQTTPSVSFSTPAATASPAASQQQPALLPPELLYSAAGATAVVAAVLAVFVLRRRKRNQTHA